MKKLPLEIATEVLATSPRDRTSKARSRIVGARHGEFIIIESPVFHLSDRLSVPLEGDIHCEFLHEGDLFLFDTRVQASLGHGLTLIDYPANFQVRPVRKDPRVQVNIQAKFRIDGSKDVSEATIQDVSVGGCYIVVGALLHIAKEMSCELKFSLPGGGRIDGVQGKVRRVKYSNIKKSTELGVQFTGPPEMLASVTSFCNYCMYFKV